MYIRINGEKQIYLPADASQTGDETVTVSDFLYKYLQGKDTKGIAFARNGTIVPRSQWGLTLVEENDEIEIVHAVQGG